MTDLTDEQERALASLRHFETSDEHMACLAGYAGVGKTFLVSRWLQEVRNLRLCVAAPTHAALKVLRAKCSGNGGLQFYTVAQLLGKAPATDPETGETEFVPTTGRKDGHFDLIVVDECSMVTAEDFSDLKRSTAKLLFVGDPAQLPPVGDKRESPAFGVPAKFQMTQIVRQQAGNPIINLSLMIRQKMASPGFVLVDDMRAVLTDDRRRFNFCTLADLYPFAEWAYREGWRAPILAFKNVTVIRHNKAMHARLYPDAPFFAEGEPVLSYENKWMDGELVLYNGEVATCVSCDTSPNPYGLPAYRVTVRRDGGARTTCYVTSDEKTLGRMKWEADRNLEYWSRKAPNRTRYNEAFDKVEYLKWFMQLRHAYACTVHKSQGSTFDAVFMDWGDIASARDAKMHYVAVTRAADCLVVAA